MAEMRKPIEWRLIAFWVWAAGVMLSILWMIVVKVRFYGAMQRSLTDLPRWAYRLYDRCCEELHVKPMALWPVESAISPGIAFFGGPVLLMPAAMQEEEKLRFAFLHELTHRKNGDHLMTELLNLLRVVYWFHPIVHLSFHEMRADMETACDAAVISRIGREKKGSYLTAVLELFSCNTQPQLGMSRISSKRMAKRRMEGAFMRGKTTPLGRAGALLMVLALLLGCFTTACQYGPKVPPTAESAAQETINGVVLEPGEAGSPDESDTADVSTVGGVEGPASVEVTVEKIDGTASSPVSIPDIADLKDVRIAAPFLPTGGDHELFHYDIYIDTNGTVLDSSMVMRTNGEDSYRRPGTDRILLKVDRANGGAVGGDNRLEDLIVQTMVYKNETLGEFVELNPEEYFGPDSPVQRMDRLRSAMLVPVDSGYASEMYTRYFIEFTFAYDYRGQTLYEDVVMGFRFLNAQLMQDGTWALAQDEADCESWLKTVRFAGNYTNPGTSPASLLKSTPRPAATLLPTPMPSPAPQPPDKLTLGYRIATAAKHAIGKPYMTGESGPDAFDDAGLIYHCLSANSIDVPKTDCEGYAALKGYKRIEDMDDLERGDVLFFEITVSDRRTVWHGGVYMGDGEMVDASSAADKVVQRRMRTDYWERYFSHALRFE